MKILKVEKETYERERRKSARILLGVFTFLVLLWPLINSEFFFKGYYMGNVQIKTFESYSKVDEKGEAVIKETVTADFQTSERFIKMVPEAAATDSGIRYRAYPIDAKIDGKKVKVSERYFGGSTHYFFIGDKMTGEHTIEFTYGIHNAVIYDKGVAVYRARLMDHAAISGVESFKGVVELPAVRTKDAVCWTSEAARVSEDADRCEFTELSSTKVVVEQDDPKYMRSVRIYVPLEGDSFVEHRVPWGNYWNGLMGKHVLIPIFALLAAVAVGLSGRYLINKFEPTSYNRFILSAVTAASVLYLSVFFVVSGLIPSILLLPWVALLWVTQGFYLRRTTGRNLLTEAEVTALQEKEVKDDPSEEGETSR